MNVRGCKSWLAVMAALLGHTATCWADFSFNVSVAYADSERPGFVSPQPWQGSPGVQFEGTQGAFWDTGALRIDNTGTSALTFSEATVTAFFDAADTNPSGFWNLWSGTSIAPGQSLILAQTHATTVNDTNFDTSDAPLSFDPSRSTNASPLGYGMAFAPLIQLVIDNTSFSFYDQDHVLIDQGLGNPTGASHNESRAWEAVGTATVPEPASALSLGLGITLVAFHNYRRRKLSKGSGIRIGLISSC